MEPNTNSGNFPHIENSSQILFLDNLLFVKSSIESLCLYLHDRDPEFLERYRETRDTLIFLTAIESIQAGLRDACGHLFENY